MSQYGNRDLGEEYQQGIFEMLKGVKDFWLESGMGLLNPNNPVYEYFREPVDPNAPPAGLLDTPSFKKMSETLPLLDPSSISGIVKGFHGSPHLFKKWSFGKDKTGEGAAAYGSGAYIAENPETAISYKTSLSSKAGQEYLYKDTPLYEYYSKIQDKAARLKDPQLEYEKLSVLEDLMLHRQMDDVINMRKDPDYPDEYRNEILKWIETDLKPNFKDMGYLYNVELKPDPDDFIQWELQFEDQPEKIRKKLIKLGEKGFLPYKFGEGVQEFTERIDTWEGLPKIETRKLNPDKKFGQEIYFDLVDSIQKKTGMGTHASAAEASRLLSGEGIPGMRYQDQGTVQGYGQEKTHNYVVYPTDESDMIQIMNPPSLID